MRQETYYQVLQVDPKATHDVIEAAFRRLARRYHPDVCTEQNEVEKMKELSAAYSVLRHPLTRVNYDKELAVVVQEQHDANKSQTLARIGIVGSIVILFAVLILAAFQGRSSAVALDGSRAAVLRDIAATDTANALLIRNAIIATLTAIPTIPTPLAIHATPVPHNGLAGSTAPSAGSIAQALTGETAQLLAQPVTSTSIDPASIDPVSAAPVSASTGLSELPATDVETNADRGNRKASAAPPEISSLITISNNQFATTSAVGAIEIASTGTESSDNVPPSSIDEKPIDDKLSQASEDAAVEEPPVQKIVVPEATQLPTPTATSFVAAVIPVPPQPTETAVERRVAIVEPDSNVESGGVQIFVWDRGFELEMNQAVELVFWRSGQDPIQHGFGLATPTGNSAIAINLDALDETLGPLLDPGLYQWGLLLVEVTPYRRLAYVGGGNDFRFTNFGTTGSAGSDRKAKSGE